MPTSSSSCLAGRNLTWPEEVEAHPDRDLWLYHGPASASFVLEGDKFVVAFPGDAHAPCIAVDAPEQVHKVVVKVKL